MLPLWIVLALAMRKRHRPATTMNAAQNRH
jgi:hypothetical protein